MTRQYYLNNRPDVAKFLPSQFVRTLEVGCGAGVFSASFLKAATERWGIEPNREAAQLAEPHFHRLFTGTFDEVADQLPDEYFDLVVCNDVIEHMPDHDKFLNAIARKMGPGGRLVGSIPNIRHFTALVKLLILKDWPYAEDGILDRTHLRFFTKRSLHRAFVSNGFVVEELVGIRSIIREGVTGLAPMPNMLARLSALLVVVGSLGYWDDVQYPQFAFRLSVARGKG